MTENKPNLYPLWWIITESAQQLLIDYQKKHYHKDVKIVAPPVDEIPIDWDKFMREAPSRSR